MDRSINQIASNRTSGAAEILSLAGEVFSELRRRQGELRIGTAEQAQHAIFKTAIALVRAQPDMSPLVRLASVAISGASTATTADEALKLAEDHVLDFIDGARRAVQAAALQASNLIRPGATVMTHSRSSTVLTALVEARHSAKDFSVVATESHPGLEGRTLATALAREDIRVRLISDSAASIQMDLVDLVLVGADTITQEFSMNKIGTKTIGLAALARGLPFYTVCDSSKFINADYWFDPVRGEGNVNALWPNAPTEALPVNGIFEPTPLDHFTGIITEEGVLSSEEASLRARRASIDKRLADAIVELRASIR